MAFKNLTFQRRFDDSTVCIHLTLLPSTTLESKNLILHFYLEPKVVPTKPLRGTLTDTPNQKPL